MAPFLWVKKNKLSAVLLAIILLFLLKSVLGSLFEVTSPASLTLPSTDSVYPEMGISNSSGPIANKFMPPRSGGAAPAPEVQNRLVVQQSDLSLLVSDVRNSVNKILDYTRSIGGYMVNSNLVNPGEVPSATVTVRIPSEQLSATLDYFRKLSLKVVSENLSGEDVTDQYVDIDARLTSLNKTKTRFEEIMAKATEVADIMNVQNEINNLQSQIDSLKGQQLYMQKTAQMAKLTIYLSTDEISLPYSPGESWRPDVIFKLAVRSLVGNLRNLGTLFIWILVYGIIWIPALLLLFYLRKRYVKNP